MQKKKFVITLGSLGSLSLVVVPLASVSFISNKQINEALPVLKKNFLITEASSKNPLISAANKIPNKVNVEDSNFIVSYVTSVNNKSLFEIFSNINSLYYLYWQKGNLKSFTKNQIESKEKLILNQLDQKVVKRTVTKTFTNYNDSIFFRIGQNSIYNENIIDFNSSWGVPNSDTGQAYANASVDVSKKFDIFTKRAESIYTNYKTTKIYNENLILKDLYLIPIIDVINPPIDGGNFVIQEGSYVENNRLYWDNKTEMLLPPGSGRGSEWYSGIAHIIPIAAGVAASVLSFIFFQEALEECMAYTLEEIIKLGLEIDPSLGTASKQQIQKALRESVTKDKNRIYFGTSDISSKNDMIDFYLKIKSYAMAKATSFWGDRTEANLNKIVGVFTNPIIQFDYKKFDYRDFN